MVGVCHYSREVRASREQVWAALTAHREWPKIPGLAEWFGRVDWYEGEPWHEGSRVAIEHFWPTHTNIHLVVLSATAPQEFSWIGHGRGLTAHQTVQMEARNADSCRLTSRMEYVLSEGELERTEADPVAQRLLHTFLDAIADEAQRQAYSARASA